MPLKQETSIPGDEQLEELARSYIDLEAVEQKPKKERTKGKGRGGDNKSKSRNAKQLQKTMNKRGARKTEKQKIAHNLTNL